MTRLIIDLTDEEIQMIQMLLVNYAEEEGNPSLAKRIQYKNNGIELNEEDFLRNKERILNVTYKINEAYRKGISLGRDE